MSIPILGKCGNCSSWRRNLKSWGVCSTIIDPQYGIVVPSEVKAVSVHESFFCPFFLDKDLVEELKGDLDNHYEEKHIQDEENY